MSKKRIDVILDQEARDAHDARERSRRSFAKGTGRHLKKGNKRRITNNDRRHMARKPS